MSAVRHAPKDRLKQKATDGSGTQRTPLFTIISRFWKCAPCFQSFSFIITVTFQADAQCPGQFGGVNDIDELSPAFFAGLEADVDVRNQYFNFLALI
jgi:hypothetical protein